MLWYLAGPFFNEHQIQLMEQIEQVFDSCNVQYYSPRVFSPGSPLKPADAAAVFSSNLDEMQKATHLLAVLDWKMPYDQGLAVVRYGEDNSAEEVITAVDLPDAGTVFEVGYFTGLSRPVVLFTSESEMRVNVMLAQAAMGTAYGLKQLRSFLERDAHPSRLSQWKGKQV